MPSSVIKPIKTAAPIKPGQQKALAIPKIPLTPNAQALAASAETAKLAAELKKKIAVYEQEIKRLLEEQNKLKNKKADLQQQEIRLEGIPEKTLKYFSYIETHCSDIVEAMRKTGKVLYRGDRVSSDPIFVGRPRENREPKDSCKKAQAMLDRFFKLLGFKALRSNSVFTSTDMSQADNYGTVYAIFPKNGFDFTWSTKHDDLIINSVSELLGSKSGADDTTPVEDLDAEDFYYMVDDMMDGLPWGSSGPITLDTFKYRFKIKSNKEANAKFDAINKSAAASKVKEFKAYWRNNVDEYHTKKKLISLFLKFMPLYTAAVNELGFKLTLRGNPEHLLGDIQGTNDKLVDPAAELALAEKVINKFKFRHDKLLEAMKSEHEICIYGEYVAVSMGEYDEDLHTFLFANTKWKNTY